MNIHEMLWRVYRILLSIIIAALIMLIINISIIHADILHYFIIYLTDARRDCISFPLWNPMNVKFYTEREYFRFTSINNVVHKFSLRFTLIRTYVYEMKNDYNSQSKCRFDI